MKEGLDAKRAACLTMIRRLVTKRQGEEEVALREKRRSDKEEGNARMLAVVVGLGEGRGCSKELFLPEWSQLRKGLKKKE